MALALMLAVSLGGVGSAEARWHRGGGPDVNYTPEQQAEMQAMWEEHYKQVEPLHRQMRAKQAELDQLYYSDSKDNAKVQKIFRDMADIKAKLYTVNNEYRAKCEAKGFRQGGMGHGHRGGHWGDGPKGPRGDGPRHGWNGGGPRGDGPRHHRGGW